MSDLNQDIDILLKIYGKYTLLPELRKFLGREKFLEFLKLFSGATINVPTDRELARWERNYQIYRRLNIDKPNNPKLIIDELMRKTGLSKERIRHVYIEIRDVIDLDKEPNDAD